MDGIVEHSGRLHHQPEGIVGGASSETLDPAKGDGCGQGVCRAARKRTQPEDSRPVERVSRRRRELDGGVARPDHEVGRVVHQARDRLRRVTGPIHHRLASAQRVGAERQRVGAHRRDGARRRVECHAIGPVQRPVVGGPGRAHVRTLERVEAATAVDRAGQTGVVAQREGVRFPVAHQRPGVRESQHSGQRVPARRTRVRDCDRRTGQRLVERVRQLQLVRVHADRVVDAVVVELRDLLRVAAAGSIHHGVTGLPARGRPA